MSNYRLFILMTCFFSFSFMACGDEEIVSIPPPIISITTEEELSAELIRIYNESNAPGFAVSVVNKDNIIYQEAFGKADLDKDINYTNRTTQPIASVSKTIVAAAVVKAIEQGYFTLETAINDILPVPIINPKNPEARVRVKHVVTHTSGLLDNEEIYRQTYQITPGESTGTAGAQILAEIGMEQRERLALADFLVEYYVQGGNKYSSENFAGNQPGQTWNYSNVATSLAAYIVEVATGMLFTDYVAMHIFQPLDMQQTAYSRTSLDPDYIATLYWDRDTPLPVYGTDSYPDSQLRSCNSDMARFLLDMTRGAKGESTTLFSAAGYEMLFEGMLSEGIIPPQLGENQGVFWFLAGDNVYHSGGDPGTSTLLAFERSNGAGFLLLSNMDSSTDEHEAAYDTFLGSVSEAINSYLSNN